MLVRAIVWLVNSANSRPVGLSLMKANRAAENPHVLLVRGSSMNRKDEGRDVLQALTCDWLRAS